MAPSRCDKRFLSNWLKAFMVSPGVLFPAAYLMLYLLLSLFLDTGFKEEICRAYGNASGNSRHLSIGSVKAGFDLCSITLQDIESGPAYAAENNRTHSIHALKIRLCGIGTFLSGGSSRELSARAASEKILDEESRDQ
jgi:hypothetical protein